MTFLIYITLFLVFIVAVLNGLPVATPANSVFLSSFQLIVGYMKMWNWMLPISEIFICVSIVSVYYGLIWGWHALMWIANKIRGHSVV